MTLTTWLDVQNINTRWQEARFAEHEVFEKIQFQTSAVLLWLLCSSIGKLEKQFGAVSSYQVSLWFLNCLFVSWQPIMKFINDQYEAYLQEEINIDRKKRIPDSRVHCCLYFIPPTGHWWVPVICHASWLITAPLFVAHSSSFFHSCRDDSGLLGLPPDPLSVRVSLNTSSLSFLPLSRSFNDHVQTLSLCRDNEVSLVDSSQSWGWSSLGVRM